MTNYCLPFTTEKDQSGCLIQKVACHFKIKLSNFQLFKLISSQLIKFFFLSCIFIQISPARMDAKYLKQFLSFLPK